MRKCIQWVVLEKGDISPTFQVLFSPYKVYHKIYLHVLHFSSGLSF